MLCKHTTAESREITFPYLSSVFCNTGLHKPLYFRVFQIMNVLLVGEQTEASLNKYFQQANKKNRSRSCIMVIQFTDSDLKTKPEPQNSISHISIPTLTNSKHVAVNSANGLKRTSVPVITAVLQLHHPLLQQNIFHISKKMPLHRFWLLPLF